jgi:hypothetical protein
MDERYRFLKPGDPGYNFRPPWGRLYEALGLPMPKKYSITGYFLLDNRRDPPLIIMKNCVMPCVAGYKPQISELKPFETAYEAFLVRKGMHLSEDDEKMVDIHAMIPDPGLGAPKPDTLIMNMRDLKGF